MFVINPFKDVECLFLGKKPEKDYPDFEKIVKIIEKSVMEYISTIGTSEECDSKERSSSESSSIILDELL